VGLLDEDGLMSANQGSLPLAGQNDKVYRHDRLTDGEYDLAVAGQQVVQVRRTDRGFRVYNLGASHWIDCANRSEADLRARRIAVMLAAG
jgi:hypothetical protein